MNDQAKAFSDELQQLLAKHNATIDTELGDRAITVNFADNPTTYYFDNTFVNKDNTTLKVW